ncbi:hypothetical protein ACLOJK_015249 [Asimina triloba]
MNSTTTTARFLLLSALLLIAAFSTSYASHPDSDSLYSSRLKKSPTPAGGEGGFFGSGAGFNVLGFGPIPGFGKGMSGGYGGGYGGPSGGHAKGGVVRPTVTCMDRGPCYKKKLQCPAKCFTSYSRSGKNYGAGGGGGGCTMDCKNKCVAYC